VYLNRVALINLDQLSRLGRYWPASDSANSVFYFLGQGFPVLLAAAEAEDLDYVQSKLLPRRVDIEIHSDSIVRFPERNPRKPS
jgi:hypothetical protein